MNLKQKLLMTPLYDWLGKRSFSQSGEDILIDSEINRKKNGFFVDIGAYHPKLFSNTYLFYKRGWRGICVDPNPEMENLYAKARPKDKFLNMGVGGKEEVAEYYMFEDGAANTFSREMAEKNEKEAGRRMVDKHMVATLPLKIIFEKYLPNQETQIDLLSIDAEGMDLEILKSNDWKKYRPEIVVCEDLDFEVKKWKDSEVMTYLDKLGYKLVGKTAYSLIFRMVSGEG